MEVYKINMNTPVQDIIELDIKTIEFGTNNSLVLTLNGDSYLGLNVGQVISYYRKIYIGNGEYLNISDNSEIISINGNKIEITSPHNKKYMVYMIDNALNGNIKALNEFYSYLGKFGLRDGVLNESTELDGKLDELCKASCPETAAILACAKEDNSVDFRLYNRCILIMKKCLENMQTSYGNIAKTRVIEQEKELTDNSRVQDALNKTIESCCKIK